MDLSLRRPGSSAGIGSCAGLLSSPMALAPAAGSPRSGDGGLCGAPVSGGLVRALQHDGAGTRVSKGLGGRGAGGRVGGCTRGWVGFWRERGGAKPTGMGC